MGLINSIFRLLRVNKKNWRAVVLCILAAGIFWFFNAMNKSYTTNISLPLEFSYDEKFYVPLAPLPEDLRVNVTGIGWDLFRRSVGWRIPPLSIELERPSAVKKIVGSTLPAIFSNQMETMQINFVVTDTLFLDLEPRGRRWVRVTIDSVEKYLRQDYGVSSPVLVTPDSVFVEGPINLLGEIKEPYRVPLNEGNIDDDYREELEIPFPRPELMRATPAYINVSFNVEKYVSITDSVRLRLINVPPSANPKLQVSKLPVTLRMQQGVLSSFSWDSLEAIVDLHGFKRGDLKVRPEVTGLPEGAVLLDIDTLRIVY